MTLGPSLLSICTLFKLLHQWNNTDVPCPPQSAADFRLLLPPLTDATVVLGYAFTALVSLQFLPQIFEVLRRRSSYGLSLTTLALELVSALANFWNIALLNVYPMLACSALGAGECLPYVQPALQGFALISSIGVLYVVALHAHVTYDMDPHAVSSSPSSSFSSHGGDEQHDTEFDERACWAGLPRRKCIELLLVVLCVIALSALSIVSLAVFGACHPVTVWVAQVQVCTREDFRHGPKYHPLHLFGLGSLTASLCLDVFRHFAGPSQLCAHHCAMVAANFDVDSNPRARRSQHGLTRRRRGIRHYVYRLSQLAQAGALYAYLNASRHSPPCRRRQANLHSSCDFFLCSTTCCAQDWTAWLSNVVSCAMVLCLLAIIAYLELDIRGGRARALSASSLAPASEMVCVLCMSGCLVGRNMHDKMHCLSRLSKFVSRSQQIPVFTSVICSDCPNQAASRNIVSSECE
jgi:hypothetical protein